MVKQHRVQLPHKVDGPLFLEAQGLRRGQIPMELGHLQHRVNRNHTF